MFFYEITIHFQVFAYINHRDTFLLLLVQQAVDLDVLMELCDRILVLCAGKVSGIVEGRKADKQKIGMMMTRVGGEQDGE